MIVEPLLERCKGVIESILQAPNRPSVASASLAIVAQMRPVVRDILQAKITLEAQQRPRADLTPCGQEAGMTEVHTRRVRPVTWWGEITIPVRTFQGRGCGTRFRPDDGPLGVPKAGACTDDVRDLYAPMAAEWPHRGANARFARCTGGSLSSCGGQGIMDRTADDLRTWQAERATGAAEAGGETVTSDDGSAERRVEIAMEGVMAHLDGRWQEAKVATILGRRLAAQAQEPTRGAVLARRSAGVLGSAEAWAVRLTQVMREAGWERLPLGEMLGDGAPWSWTGATAHVPGVRQTLDDDHLRAHLWAFAQRQYPPNPAGANAWVDQNMGAPRTDRVGEVLGALKRMRPWQKAVRNALSPLIGDVARTRTRIRYQAPWHRGLALGSGAVEGACKPVRPRRFTRAGMRWTLPGFLHVLVWRIASLNDMFEKGWASRGLAVQTSAGPTQ